MPDLKRDPATSISAIRGLGMADVYREQAESLLHNIFLAHEAGRMGDADASGLVREAKGRGTGFALGLLIGNRITGSTSARLTEVFRAAADDDQVDAE